MQVAVPKLRSTRGSGPPFSTPRDGHGTGLGAPIIAPRLVSSVRGPAFVTGAKERTAVMPATPLASSAAAILVWDALLRSITTPQVRVFGRRR